MHNETTLAQGSEMRLFIILSGALAFALMISFVFGTKVERGDVSVPSEVAVRKFPEVSLGAKAAYVYDVRTKTVLFAKNEDARLPLASLTKVMSALVARELSPLYSTVTITDKALATDGDSGLLRDEVWSLDNLLDFSLITSSNDGVRAVALALGALNRADATEDEILSDFVVEMNEKAFELGLEDTYFWNETGLDISQGNEVRPGAFGTARDMGSLLEYILIYHPELFAATRESLISIGSLDNREHMAKNTNIIATEIPRLLASKTGFTNTAGGNLVVIFDPELGRPVIISILGSTEKGRFADVKTLVDAVMEYIEGEEVLKDN